MENNKGNHSKEKKKAVETKGNATREWSDLGQKVAFCLQQDG